MMPLSLPAGDSETTLRHDGKKANLHRVNCKGAGLLGTQTNGNQKTTQLVEDLAIRERLKLACRRREEETIWSDRAKTRL